MTLSPPETRELSAFAGIMIPASARYGVPGADDPAIFADIVKSLGRDRDGSPAWFVPSPNDAGKYMKVHL